ncbi:MAG: hypothetical protein GXO86_05635 [Chlorobi bacterium]|nr:hypothetical protein [Chlorobiota bacterium]
MKKLAVILFFIPMFSFSQISDQAVDFVFNHANTIVIDTNLTLTDIAHYLQDHGYIIDKKDKDLQSISTKPFLIWKSSNQTGVIDLWKDHGDIIITAQFSVSQFGFTSTDKMEKRGTGNVKGKLFQIVDEFAKQMAKDYETKISYLKL